MEPTPATLTARTLAGLSAACQAGADANDAFARAWWRARPDETTAEAAERGLMAGVAAWVGHPVQRLA